MERKGLTNLHDFRLSWIDVNWVKFQVRFGSRSARSTSQQALPSHVRQVSIRVLRSNAKTFGKWYLIDLSISHVDEK